MAEARYPLLTAIATMDVGPEPRIAISGGLASVDARLRWEKRREARDNARALLGHVARASYGA